jgi:hypothetical protein
MKGIILAVVFGSLAIAQSGNPVTQAVSGAYNRVKQNLIEAAEAMPADQYGYKLTPPQRAFGDWIVHTAMANEGACSAVKGMAKPPVDHSKHTDAAKADAQRMLKASFDLCDEVLTGMNDQKMVTEVTAGPRKVVPVTQFVNLIATLNSHYGNLVGYMRSKAIVPPSTARSQKKK